MQHKMKYWVLAAAVAGLGLGAYSAANAQGSGDTNSNATSSSGASPSPNAGPPPGRLGGGHFGPGDGWDRRGGSDRRGNSFRRDRSFRQARWNSRRGGRFGHRGPRGRRGPGMRGPGMRGGGGQMLVGPLLQQVRQLDLSDQQRQRVRDLFTQARKQQQSNATRPRVDLSVIGDPGSRGYAKAVQDAKNRAADRIQRQSELATQIYDVLTSVQKRQLATLLAADEVRMQQREQRMQQMRQRRQQRRSGSSGGGSSSSAG